ncbi:MAG TPA: DUF4238 domain-containing protein [Burkholderiaceae bacterium]|jgi:hypothetical protein
MPALRNHHYVPQFYFRRFSADAKSICLLTRATGKTVARASIKGQASKIGYYGDEEVEKALGEIEGACCAALHRLDQVENPLLLSEDEIDLFLVHLTLQRTRTEAARQNSKAFQDKMARLVLEVQLNNSTEISDADRALLLESLPDVEANPIHSQRMEMGIAVEQSPALRDLTPVVLVNKTNRPFIFGDAPVVFYNAYYRDVQLRGVLGLDTPGLMVFFPLSATKCLALLDTGCYRVREGRDNQLAVRDLGDVLALNKLQIHAASSCVYFSDTKFAAYVTEAWRQEQGRLTKHEGMVVEAPGRNASTGADMGDIVHGYQPQLTYLLKLSFLKHKVLGDEVSAPMSRRRRNQ